ncbi:MAG: Txe/YoeB family addiction module toxin [Puniceicoccales bacterium]|nr:Txe/YoeB family addiction module toxin [Puniceicoccales bacterium]
MLEFRKSHEFVEDYDWFERHDSRAIAKIDRLVRDIRLHPKSGIGKPEPLRHQGEGFWSRRIDRKNRLVYHVGEEVVLLLHCRGHYEA